MVRLHHHQSLTVIEGTVRAGQISKMTYVEVPTRPGEGNYSNIWLKLWLERGNTIELVKRSLPTKPGLYTTREGWAASPPWVYLLSPAGNWYASNGIHRGNQRLREDSVPDNLIALVPATD